MNPVPLKESVVTEGTTANGRKIFRGWLEFNEDVQGALCKVCKKWAQETRHRSRDVWTTEPFMNWKKGPEKCESMNEVQCT